MDDVLGYLKDCYAFNLDPAIKQAIDEIERLRNVLLEIKQTSYEEAADRIAVLEKALHAMLHAVCHETGFAAAVRADSGKAYPWEPLDAAEEQARAALEGKDD